MRLHVVNRPALGSGPGRGHVLVAVHGTMDRAASFRRLWTHLEDWDVLAYDRRGYAGSAALPLARDFAEQVGDLRSVLEARSGCPRTVVGLGHSFGGHVVLAAAAAHPDLFQAAVIYEPPGLWQGGWSRPGAAELPPGDQAERFVRQVAGDRVWERLSEATRAQRRAEGATMVNDLSMLGAGPPFEPGDVAIPVVVGYGSRTPARATSWARELAGRLPLAELVEVPGAEHGIHVGDPAALAALVRRAAAFLAAPASRPDPARPPAGPGARPGRR